MIALTFVAVLLLGIVVAQWATADWLAHRRATRLMRARRVTVDVRVGEELVSSIARRLRLSSAGGTVGLLGTLALCWLIVRDPTGAPDLALVGLLLTALMLGYALAVVVDVVRTTPERPSGVRVAGLTSREPHRTAREALAETVLVSVAGVVLAVTITSLVVGVDGALAATVCAVAALHIMATTGATRRWVLSLPAPAADADHSVAVEVLTASTADELTENLVSNGAVLVFYAVILLVSGVGTTIVLLLLGLLTIGALASVVAASERRHAARSVTP